MTRPVVLAHLDWQRPGNPRTGLGVASIAASTMAAGVDTCVVSDAVNRAGFDAHEWADQVVDALHHAGPGALLGVSAYVWSEPEVQQLLRTVRARSEATIVVGGPQVSYLATGQLETYYPLADAFVRGHGEVAMVMLATDPDARGHGIHHAGEPDGCRRSDAPLDGLPSPYLTGTIPIGASVRWETQRGCPYACTFCQHREVGARLTNGQFDAGRLRAEAEAFAAAGVQRVSVLDPIFHANRPRAVALLHMLRDVGVRATLSLQCRFELVDEAFLDALDGMEVELEFGLQTAIEDESKRVGRRNHMGRVEHAIQMLHERRIPFEVSLIYGLPGQTLSSFETSVAWCRDHGIEVIRAWPLMLLRGTTIEAERDRWGFVESTEERIPIVVASHSFTRPEHARMATIAADLAAPAMRGAA